MTPMSTVACKFNRNHIHTKYSIALGDDVLLKHSMALYVYNVVLALRQTHTDMQRDKWAWKEVSSLVSKGH